MVSGNVNTRLFCISNSTPTSVKTISSKYSKFSHVQALFWISCLLDAVQDLSTVMHNTINKYNINTDIVVKWLMIQLDVSFWLGMSCEFLSIVWPSLSSCDMIVFQLVRGLESWEEWVWCEGAANSSHVTHLAVALQWWQSMVRLMTTVNNNESVLCPQLLLSGGEWW